jgi:hypothetical protein
MTFASRVVSFLISLQELREIRIPLRAAYTALNQSAEQRAVLLPVVTCASRRVCHRIYRP